MLRQRNGGRFKIHRVLEEEDPPKGGQDATMPRRLYGLETLTPFSQLDHDLPSISPDPTARSILFSTTDRAATDQVFIDRLKEAEPFWDGFDFKAHNLVLVGRAVFSLVMSPILADKSFTLCVIGHENLLSAKRGLEAHAQARWNDGTSTSVWFQSGHTLYGMNGTSDSTIQLIHATYPSYAEVLTRYDFGPDAALFDGERVLLSATGRLAAEHGILVPIPGIRRRGLEMRLAEFFNFERYEIVLPKLNTKAVVSAHKAHRHRWLRQRAWRFLNFFRAHPFFPEDRISGGFNLQLPFVLFEGLKRVGLRGRRFTCRWVGYETLHPLPKTYGVVPPGPFWTWTPPITEADWYGPFFKPRTALPPEK
jgi:hypothetical protein